MAQVAAQGKSTNAFDLAALYLYTNGYPNTAKNRVILAAWFMAESARIGKFNINVMNNNPLFITGGSSYFQLKGKNGDWLRMSNGQPFHYSAYAGTSAGAQAWGSLIRSNKNYAGINTALMHQDAPGLAFAIARSPWGSNGAAVTSAYHNLMNTGGLAAAATVNNLADGTAGLQSGLPGGNTSGGATLTDSGSSSSKQPIDGNKTAYLGAWYINGSPIVMLPREKVITEADVNYMMTQLTSNYAEYNQPVSGPIASDLTRQILMLFVGDRWNEQTITNIQASFLHSAGSEGAMVAGAQSVLNTVGQAATGPGSLISSLGGIVVHGGAMLAGALLMFFGVKLMIDGTVKSGGSDGVTIVNRERTVPAFRKDDFEDSGDDTLEVGDAEDIVDNTDAKPPKVSPIGGGRTRRAKWGGKFPEYIDNTANNPSSATIAPLKKDSGAA